MNTQVETVDRDSRLLRHIDASHHFAQQLFFRRTEAGMSQRGVARALECDPSHISYMEAGHRDPSLEMIAALSVLFDCEPWEMLHPVEGEEASAEELIGLSHD